MKNHQNQTSQGNQESRKREHPQRYVLIDNVKVPVSEEVYREYMRPEWAERKRKERAGRCRGKNGSRCQEDCLSCKVDRNGRTKRPLASDKLKEIERQSGGAPDASELAMNNLLIDELKAALGTLDSKNRMVIDLLFYEGMTEREAAAKIGMSQKGVNKRKTRTLEILREQLMFLYS